MHLLKHRRPATLFTSTTTPTQALTRRPRAVAVRPRAALGPTLLGVAKTAVISAAITGIFGGLLEVMAPHGQKSTKRVAGAVRFGGAVGGAIGLGVALPQAIAVVAGIPLGVVVGTSLATAWAAMRTLSGPHGGR